MIDANKSKQEIFETLTSQGENAKTVAYLIASHPDPLAYERHFKMVNNLITIMFVGALIAAVIGFFAGSKLGGGAAWIFAIMGCFFPLLFAYGFYKNLASAYNIYIVLSLVRLPQSLVGIVKEPTATLIGVTISMAVLIYVWKLRANLFPDFNFIGPRKVNGQYVFSN